jgi:large subunit ribosomal protein L18e
VKRIDNPVLDKAIYTLRQAFKRSKAPIWPAVIEELLKPRSRRRQVNVGRISRLTARGDVVLVPGKVLGGGILTHNLVIGAYDYSQIALQKISKTGGKALFLDVFSEKYIDGKNVKLFG